MLMKKTMLMALLVCFGFTVVGCSTTSTTSSNTSKAQSKSSKKNNFTTIFENHKISAGAPKNPFNTNGNVFLSFDQMQLAWSAHSATDLNKSYPGLAQKWKLSKDGTKVTLWLQPKAKWSNGKPVTAKDVKTSMAIAFTQGNAQSFFLGAVNVVSPTEIEFTQVPGQHYNKFLPDLLQQTIVPDFEYGKLLPKNIWTVIKNSQYSGNDTGKKAKAKAAQAKLTKIGKQVTQFAPKKDISAGPFVLKNLNPGSAFLVKNPDFYAANKVKVDSVTFRNYTGNQQIWNYLIAGSLDEAPFTAMPKNTLNRILKTKGNKKVVTPSYVAASLAFNQGIYPYGMPAVRKALAYVIDRQAVQKVAEPVVGTVPQYTDGMVDKVAKQWLTQSQFSQMNKYNHNLKKATHLLQKAGFKKQGGKWMMPNGKPWTATVYSVSGFNDWIQAAKVISTEMTSFGIPSQPNIVSSYSLYLKNLAAGKYAIGFWLDALGPSMYSTYGRLYGNSDGYNVVGGKLVRYPSSNKAKGNWLDVPKTIKLPDGTKVNPGKLTYQLNSLTPSQQRAIVQKLALATNVNLPVIKLWNYINVQFVNTSRFTDFPTKPGILDNFPGVWMAMGYVHPKS